MPVTLSTSSPTVPQGLAHIFLQAFFPMHGTASDRAGDAADGYAHADAFHEPHNAFCHDSKHSFQLRDWFPLF